MAAENPIVKVAFELSSTHVCENHSNHCHATSSYFGWPTDIILCIFIKVPSITYIFILVV